MGVREKGKAEKVNTMATVMCAPVTPNVKAGPGDSAIKKTLYLLATNLAFTSGGPQRREGPPLMILETVLLQSQTV